MAKSHRLNAWRRLNPPPAKRAKQPNDCADAQSPSPAKVCAEPRSDHRREQADAVAACVHDRCGCAAALAMEIDSHGPKRRFTKAERSERGRETGYDPVAVSGEDAKDEKQRT